MITRFSLLRIASLNHGLKLFHALIFDFKLKLMQQS